MTAAVLVAAVAAVLTPHRVVFVDTVQGAVLRVAELPGEGLAIFAAPDGRAVVPLQGENATAIVGPTGRVEAWPGRVFPLFFADYDRMYVVLPDMLATLSYPDRLLLERVPLQGVSGARRAACSRDGQLVAIIPAMPGVRALVLVVGLESPMVQRVNLVGEAAHVVVAPPGAFAVVASGDTLEATILGEPAARAGLNVGGEVLSLSLLTNGRDVIAGLASGTAGELVGVRVDPKAQHPLKERFRTRVPAPVVAVAAAGEDVAAISGDSLVILTGGWAADRQTGPAARGARPRRAPRQDEVRRAGLGRRPQTLSCCPLGNAGGKSGLKSRLRRWRCGEAWSWWWQSGWRGAAPGSERP